MESWNIFTLQPYQTWLGDIIQEQWIDPILKTLIDNDAAGIVDEPIEAEGYTPPEEQVQQKPKVPAPTPTSTTAAAIPPNTPIAPLPRPKPINTPLVLIHDPRTGEIEISDQDWRIKVIFEPANMDT